MFLDVSTLQYQPICCNLQILVSHYLEVIQAPCMNTLVQMMNIWHLLVLLFPTHPKNSTEGCLWFWKVSCILTPTQASKQARFTSYLRLVIDPGTCRSCFSVTCYLANIYFYCDRETKALFFFFLSLHTEAPVNILHTLWKFNDQGPRTGQKYQTTTMANIRFSNFLKTRVSEKAEDCLHLQRSSKHKRLIPSGF